MFLKSLLTCALFLVSARTLADVTSSGIRFGWTALQDEHITNYSGSVQTDTLTTHINTKLGYQFLDGFYLGALYESTNSYVNATGTPVADVRVSYGPTLGYKYSNFNFYISYFASSKEALADGRTFSSGSSFEAELSYDFPITSYFLVGVSFVYENFSWSQVSTGGSSTGQTNTQTDDYPAISAIFLF